MKNLFLDYCKGVLVVMRFVMSWFRVLIFTSDFHLSVSHGIITTYLSTWYGEYALIKTSLFRPV